MPQPLPAELPEYFNISDKNAESEIPPAYSRILLLEQAAHSNTNHEIREQKLIHARVLGYLILEGPSMRAIQFVAREVNACRSEDQLELEELGEMYLIHYLRALWRYKGVTISRTPPSSRSSYLSSPISFETIKEMVEDILRQPDRPQADGGKPEPRNLQRWRLDHVPGRQRSDFQAKKNAALVRDDFRCVVSGRYHSRSVCKNRELKEEVLRSRTETCLARCTYILPHWQHSTSSRTEHNFETDISGLDAAEVDATTGSSKLEHKRATSLYAIIKCFGYKDLPEKSNAAGSTTIHGLDNVITLDPSIRILFDELLLWFEAIDGEENTYAIRATEEFFLFSCKENPITFKSAHTNLPLPNPACLRIHAACCKIAHLSGAGEYMSRMSEDLEDTRVLAEDGSSAHVLSFALQPHI